MCVSQVTLLLLSLSTISVPLLSQESDWSSICVLQVTLLLLSLSTIAVPVLSQESD